MNKKNIIIIAIILFLIVGAVAVWMFLRPIPALLELEKANVIFRESMQNTLELDSLTITGDANLRVKDGEIVILEIGMKDSQISTINPFDFANQNSSMVGTYNVMINLKAIIDSIKAGKTREELEKLKEPDLMIGLMKAARAMGKANILITMEMKSIDFDSYKRIVKIEGLREVITGIGGMFLANMIMGEIEQNLGVWQKIPVDPAMREEMIAMFEPIEKIIPSFFGISYVKEILPNTRINDTPVYNFVTDIDWTKAKNVIISFIEIIPEKQEMTPEDLAEKEKLIVKIRENWPIVKKIINRVIEINSATYIDQRTRFILKDRAVINVSLFELMMALKEIAPEEKTPEEIAEFERMREKMKNINIVITANFRYRDHNAVPAIVPPAEYEVIKLPDLPIIAPE